MSGLFLDYQRRVLDDRAGVRVIEKSRRIGMTWALAFEAVANAIEGTCNTYYMAYAESQAREFIRDCEKWALFLERGARAEYGATTLGVDLATGQKPQGIQAGQITFASEARIVALTGNARNLRGKQGNVLLDEFAFSDDQEELLKASFALRMWGNQVTICSTHNGVDNTFNKIVEDVRAGKLPYSLHRVTVEDALRGGLFRRICRTSRTRWSAEAERAWLLELQREYGDAAREELFCEPSRGGVTYFARDVVESRMVKGRPVLRLYLGPEFAMRPEAERVKHVDDWLRIEVLPRLSKLPKDRQHFLGVDFGRTADLSVMVPCTLQPDLTRDVPFLLELSNVPFEQQKQIAFHLLDKLPRLTRAHFDATGNGHYLAEVCAQRYGTSRIEQVKIGERWHLESWPPLRAALEEDKLRLPSDEEVRADFTAVKRVGGIPKLPSAATLKVVEGGETKTIRRHGDAAVACAMMWAATRDVEDALGRADKWKRAASGL